MSWMVAGGMAALGAIQASQQQKQARKQNKANAEAAAAQTRNSPWTNMGAGDAGPMANEGGGALMGAAQGGLTGYMTAKANPDMFGSKTTQKVAPQPPTETPISDSMNFGDYSGMGELQKKYGVKKPY